MIRKNTVKKKACASAVNTSVRSTPDLGSVGFANSKTSRKRKTVKKCTDYQDYLSELLQDKDFALGYINLSLEEEDPRMFLLAVKSIVMAQKGGMAEVAKKTGLNRQNFYRMLSLNGNPSWKSLKAIFDVLGFKLQLVENKIVENKKVEKGKSAVSKGKKKKI